MDMRRCEKQIGRLFAAEMATLVATHLPRFRPFTDAGYTVDAPVVGRTLLDRTLQWTGLQS